MGEKKTVRAILRKAFYLESDIKRRRKLMIDVMVECWRDDHTCGDLCGSDPDRMCRECYYEDAQDRYAAEYREKLNQMILSDLKNEEYFDSEKW